MIKHVCEAMTDDHEDCGAPARRLVEVRRGLGQWQVWGFCEDHITEPERELRPAGFQVRAA
jgi:hypothetical protein